MTKQLESTFLSYENFRMSGTVNVHTCDSKGAAWTESLGKTHVSSFTFQHNEAMAIPGVYTAASRFKTSTRIKHE